MYNSRLYWTLSYVSFWCISVSAFASLIGITKGLMSSAIGWKLCAIAAGIKTFNSITKKNKKKHDRMALLAKSKLISIEILISNV